MQLHTWNHKTNTIPLPIVFHASNHHIHAFHALPCMMEPYGSIHGDVQNHMVQCMETHGTIWFSVWRRLKPYDSMHGDVWNYMVFRMLSYEPSTIFK